MSGSWTALLPLKPPADRKSRLAPLLTPAQRLALTEDLLARALRALGACPDIGEILLMAASSGKWSGNYVLDQGRGLNAELQAARRGRVGNLLVLFPDLPFVTSADIEALLANPPAMAPDRHGTGTNAIALPDGAPFTFAFGANSCAAHAVQASAVTRSGLAFDIDTPADFHASGLAL